MLSKNFGRALCNARREGGMSRATIADAAGVTRQFVRLLERGERDVSLDRASRLAKAVGKTVCDLLR